MAITFQTATLATAPGSTIVATDDAGGSGHVQLFKLAISTAGSVTLVPADAANGLDVDVTRLPALAAGTNNIGDVDVLTVPTDPFGANADAASATGSISAKLRFIASTGIPVTGTVTVGSHAVTNAGTFAVQESQVLADNAGFTDGTSKVWPTGYIFDEVAGTALTENDVAAARVNANRAQVFTLEDDATRGRRLTITAANAAKVDGSAVTQPVSGTVTATGVAGVAAHDAGISGNPVRVAGRARTSEVTAVANDDTADFVTDVTGKQIVLPFANPENFVSGVSSTTGTGDTSTIGAQGAGIRTYLTGFSFVNSSATATVVEIKDNTTVKWRTMAPAGGGSNHTFPVPLVGTANTAWNIAALTGVTTLYASLAGYKGV